ncbi:DsbA family oxidoreductase [Paraburkholderia silvatlantica]|uniref:DsbA family dithiol-disulfide isomerase n=1 Tax=Paraburkholderia silvatlantica TaxID=321895 RepID=A0ABR6FG97_9BURK|nr:DsbA family oxidoreductase [Paraburkholderia silvatlantica]MBB2926423.1 putative DsbA family dithiol-disulfide isomerase [Paraburkholderia silvatlantica]PVY25018.1 putative DsbA family dithiol-disulfide isomerase [Paraburkholderia silvatlantica]PXW30102.1 putative DsbA family dithiol-disulfide isomerase [Paraburkholderia silvatlantica]
MNLSDQKWAAQASRDAGEPPVLTVDAFFDFICPWCLIGKRNLDAALARFARSRPDVRVRVQWRSHQLLPWTPLEGMPYQAFYRDRLGSAEAVAARRAQVQRAGRDAGVEFAFERIAVLPNTAAAHDLVTFAVSCGAREQSAALIDRVLNAYFMEGQNIGDYAVLERLGLECGLEREPLAAHIAASKRLAEPTGRRTAYADPQVSGVPYFVFNTDYSLSGVYSPVAMAGTMALALEH